MRLITLILLAVIFNSCGADAQDDIVATQSISPHQKIENKLNTHDYFLCKRQHRAQCECDWVACVDSCSKSGSGDGCVRNCDCSYFCDCAMSDMCYSVYCTW